MTHSKSKLSRFPAANRTITACQAMKNTKGQEHRSERDKIPATKRDKSCLQIFYQLKANLTTLSNLRNKTVPKNLDRTNNLHVLICYKYLYCNPSLHYTGISPKLIPNNACIVFCYYTQALRLLSLLFNALFFSFLLTHV